MSTTQDREKSNYRLGQYYHNFFGDRGRARQFFRKETNIDYIVQTTKYLELENPSLIGCTALHIAALKNCSSDIEYLLGRGVDPMIKNQNGLTAIHLAVKDKLEPIDHSFNMKSACASMLLSAQVSSGNSENPTDGNGLSHFHIACLLDHAEAIEFFISSGVSVDETVNVDSPYFPGYTPLHLAAKYSALEAMKLLFKYEANKQLKNAEDMTFLDTTLEVRFIIVQPLSDYKMDFLRVGEAANLKVMNFLVQNAVETIEHSGLTLVHVACFMGDLSIVEGLLHKISEIDQALDVDDPHWPGYTPLHFAAYSSIEIAKLLVTNGANLLARGARNGVTPLDMCIEKYGVEDVHALLSLDESWKSVLMSDRKTRLLSLVRAMKDVNAFNNFFETREKIVNTYVPSDAPAWQGFTPLHLAVVFYDCRTPDGKRDERSEHIIKKLLAKGSNINAQDSRGWSPIHLAWRQHVLDNEKQATKFLLEFHDKIEDVIDEDNLSHLHIACELHSEQSVESILRTNVDVNIAIKGHVNLSVGSTPLHCAATNDDIVKLLMARGANPLLKNANNLTPIHLSAGCSQRILSSLHLTDSIADDHLSHLHVAVKNGNVTAVRKLLDYGGASVNQVWRSNVSSCITTLDLAIADESTEMMELLLRGGAEILVKEPNVPTRVPTEEASNALKPVVSSLNGDDVLFKRLEKGIGLTMLHLTCFRRDVDSTKALLASGADVHARIDGKSRLWPEYTPLHCAVDDVDPDEKIDEIVSLLLDRGADVYSTTGFGQQETALLMIYCRFPPALYNHQDSCMKMILRAHKDFTVNPATIDGLSHFHVACDLGDVISVEQFLKHGVGVNRRMAFFQLDNFSNDVGCPPLHFVGRYAAHRDPMTQLKLIDLLLNYGADVDAEDVGGNTALHLVYEREGDLLRLIESKANVHSRNIYDETPLEKMITYYEGIMTIDKINCFLKFGCHFNLFNCHTDKGLIAMALELLSHGDGMYLIRSSMINFPRLMQAEETGRTVMHNIVSNTKVLVNDKRISVAQYIELIDELGKFDHDVDAQDKLGRAPLHLAVLFRNIEAIKALLVTGADVNVSDANEHTAFSYLFQPCTRCSDMRKRRKKHDHFDIFSIFVMHIKKSLLCELTVNRSNENLLFEAFERLSAEDLKLPKLFKDKMNEVRSLTSDKLSLGRFLSDTDAVVAHSTVPQADRDIIDHVFKNELGDLRMENVDVASILLLQYRKAVKRVESNESAKIALNVLSRLPMPDLCSRAILGLLSNSDLNSMIKATA